MFLYDPQIQAAAQTPPNDISGVLGKMQIIDGLCQDTDGLKWFNWLYMSVTDAIKAKVDAGAFQTGAWLTELDVNFARMYFGALYDALSGQPCPRCWNVVFSKRDQAEATRIQFALAGMNSHINHDLPVAIVSTGQAAGVVPQHGTQQYTDYTDLNPVLDAVIDPAKKALNVTLAGNVVPGLAHIEDIAAAWDLSYYREKAWNSAQAVWPMNAQQQASHMNEIDWGVAGMNEILLVPV